MEMHEKSLRIMTESDI